MINQIKKASSTIISVIFAVIGCMSILALPSRAYADSTSYNIGDTGPAGGLIFYINGSSFLEAAPYDAPDFYNWPSAISICSDFSFGGYADWFLPSIYQLELMYKNLHSPDTPNPSLGNFQNSYYWSSTEINFDQASEMNFSNGSTVDWSKSDNYDLVRAIRAFTVINRTKNTKLVKKLIEKPVEEVPWVRNNEMTCYQVWINENNTFEFVFWWEYANNNWVKIYDINGNEVFSIDMEIGNAHFEANLPDGTYMVKTFHDQPEPIQEFIISKP
jgi:hypothetical protein